MIHINFQRTRRGIAGKRRHAIMCMGAFTLIELMLSMALISIAITIFVQASGMFGDKLSAIQKRAATESELMRLALYLDGLQDIEDVSSSCGPDATSRELVCVFHSSSGGMEKRLPIFSLASNGFVSAEWGIVAEQGISLRYLSLIDGASRKTIIHYGIFPDSTIMR